MVGIFLHLLIVICLCLLLWGVIRIERIYQYPFFMGSIFVSFIIPQAIALINNPGSVTQEALERILLYTSLCAIACLLGYEYKANINFLRKLSVTIDDKKMFRAGIVLMSLGYLFNFLLSRVDIQITAQGTWTGPATILYFFSQVIYIALPIFLLNALKRPTITNLFFTVATCAPIIQTILIGRRTQTMIFVTIIGLSLWLVYRYLPPRLLVVTGVFLLMFLIPIIGQLRSGFWNLILSGNWQEVVSATQQAFSSQQQGDLLEYRNAALVMDGVEKTNLYGYGTGLWDRIIFQYVPGQLLGFEFKKSLQFNLFNPEILKELYGYSLPNGTTLTGVGDSFMEFGYFGCLIFALLGYVFKHLWISSLYQNSIFSKLLYMGLLSPSMIGVTHGIGTFIQLGIFQIVVVSIVTQYSRVK